MLRSVSLVGRGIDHEYLLELLIRFVVVFYTNAKAYGVIVIVLWYKR